MTCSGIKGWFTGKPWPPARCQRIWEIHPPATWNKLPVVSSLESLERNPTKGATYSSCGVESATGYEGHKKISDLYCLNIDITATEQAFVNTRVPNAVTVSIY